MTRYKNIGLLMLTLALLAVLGTRPGRAVLLLAEDEADTM